LGRGALEAELGVRRDRRRIVGLDVQDDPAYAAGRQVGESRGGDGLAEAPSLGGRIDGDDVDLAEVGGVLLGPVEGEQPVAGVRDEQALRVEPGLGHPLGEVGGIHRTLLGVMGERRRVHPDHLVGVGVAVTADRHTLDRGDVYGTRLARHHPEGPGGREAEAARECCRRGMIGVRPGRHVGRRSPQGRLGQGPTGPPTPALGGHGHVEVVAAEQREAVVREPDSVPLEPAMSQRQAPGLVDRCRAVGLGRLRDHDVHQREHPLEVSLAGA
jgi:hypothetical protein